MKAGTYGCLAALFVIVCSGAAQGQPSKSAQLAQELTAALDAAKLDCIAAKDPAHQDVYVGALYIPGLQLLAISAQYTAPQLLDERLEKHEYREVYIDLNSAGEVGTKQFVEDLGSNGLQARRDGDDPFDSFAASGKRTAFAGNWAEQKLSEQEYLKVYAEADERYAQMLTALLAQLRKKPS